MAYWEGVINAVGFVNIDKLTKGESEALKVWMIRSANIFIDTPPIPLASSAWAVRAAFSLRDVTNRWGEFSRGYADPGATAFFHTNTGRPIYQFNLMGTSDAATNITYARENVYVYGIPGLHAAPVLDISISFANIGTNPIFIAQIEYERVPIDPMTFEIVRRRSYTSLP